MEWRGCVCRIRDCVFELLSTEDDLIQQDEDTWELMASELRLKSTFLYCDLNQLISNTRDEHKKVLTDLANRLFHSMEELNLAVKNRSISLAQARYNDAAHILQEVMAALLFPHQVEH